MKRTHLTLAIAILTIGFAGSCSKIDNGSKHVDPIDDGSRRFVVLSDIHLMHPDLLVSEGEAFDRYNWEENKLLHESPDIFAALLEQYASEKETGLLEDFEI